MRKWVTGYFVIVCGCALAAGGEVFHRWWEAAWMGAEAPPVGYDTNCVMAFSFDNETDCNNRSWTNSPPSGWNVTATNTSADTAPVWADGAMDFDGLNDYMRLPQNDILQSPTNTDQISFCAWINPDTITASGTEEDVIIFSGQVIVRLQTDDDVESFIIDDAAAAVQVLPNTAGWTTNLWQHYALTFDNVNAVIYRNGIQLVKTNHAGSGVGHYGGVLPQIGGEYGKATEFFDGRIDDARVYNRALTSNEVFGISIAGRSVP